jgi:hypothetical protein
VVLTRPDFKLSAPNPNPLVTDAEWWLWLRLHELEPSSQLGGIYAAKPGFHNRGDRVNDYSTRDRANQSGPGMTHASALDWTFPSAQRGDFSRINLYTKRLVASSLDSKDPRLDLVLFEFFGQADSDRHVEGRDLLHDQDSTADDTHLWHLHFSFLRSRCADFHGMWALLTVLMKWDVTRWRGSVPVASTVPTTPTPVSTPAGLPSYPPGSRTLRYVAAHLMAGTDVAYVQRFIGPARCGPADGIAGPKFDAGTRWYQTMRGLPVDGVVAALVWHAMGVG